MEVSVRLVGSAAFKAVGTSEPRPAGSIPVHLRQFFRAVLCAVLGFWLLAPVSSAGADPAEPGNTRSVTEGITPATSAISVDIIGNDAFVRIKVQPGYEVAVVGYDEEPYLLIDKQGRVFENTWSPTLSINKTRYGTSATVTSVYDQAAKPEWKQIATGGTTMWHDHRVHWMSPLRPAAINDKGLVQEWFIDMKIDGVPTVVSGSLYVGDTPGSWWWLLAVPATALAMLVRERQRRWLIVAAAIGVLGVGLSVYFGVPSAARATPTLGALAVVALVSLAIVSIVKKNEFVAALSTTSATALLVAIAIHRNFVNNRYIPGLGDAMYVRWLLPVALGISAAVAWCGLNALLRVPSQQLAQPIEIPQERAN